MKKGRILSGMRPTGKMHLGNYVGALENWVKLQGQYENFHMVADWHALTTDLHTDDLHQNTIDMVIDWIAAGIDPEISPIFAQSQIKEHAELFLLFSMLVTTPRLERNPTLKEQVKDLHLEGRISLGHLGYPVLQAADILIYKADLVPVGEDQVPHIELTRELARRFNSLYGEIFPEPQAKLTRFARLPGTDGNRMSKSLGNTILLSDAPDEIRTKVMSAITDPQKIYRKDPGHPEVCTVFVYDQRFNPEEIAQIERDCRNASLGCVDCKRNLAEKLIDFLTPFREKRAELEKNISLVEDILQEGAEMAREVASSTMVQVREAMKVGMIN
jgi:tryptophanyl-tRNA synthetase